jgi:Ni,Fe-hydrogenase I cytochrome b subunit
MIFDTKYLPKLLWTMKWSFFCSANRHKTCQYNPLYFIAFFIKIKMNSISKSIRASFTPFSEKIRPVCYAVIEIIRSPIFDHFIIFKKEILNFLTIHNTDRARLWHFDQTQTLKNQTLQIKNPKPIKIRLFYRLT